MDVTICGPEAVTLKTYYKPPPMLNWDGNVPVRLFNVTPHVPNLPAPAADNAPFPPVAIVLARHWPEYAVQCMRNVNEKWTHGPFLRGMQESKGIPPEITIEILKSKALAEITRPAVLHVEHRRRLKKKLFEAVRVFSPTGIGRILERFPNSAHLISHVADETPGVAMDGLRIFGFRYDVFSLDSFHQWVGSHFVLIFRGPVQGHDSFRMTNELEMAVTIIEEESLPLEHITFNLENQTLKPLTTVSYPYNLITFHNYDVGMHLGFYGPEFETDGVPRPYIIGENREPLMADFLDFVSNEVAFGYDADDSDSDGSETEPLPADDDDDSVQDEASEQPSSGEVYEPSEVDPDSGSETEPIPELVDVEIDSDSETDPDWLP